jgi:hypothetical protein
MPATLKFSQFLAASQLATGAGLVSGASSTGFVNAIAPTPSGGGASIFQWNFVNPAQSPVTIAPGNGYVAVSGAVVFNMPEIFPQGEIFQIGIAGASASWTLNLFSGQLISNGSVGARTSVVSQLPVIGPPQINVTDGITAVCITSNLNFIVLDFNGNPEFIT